MDLAGLAPAFSLFRRSKALFDRTIEFRFPDAHPDFPRAAALPVTAPVPQAQDTRTRYRTTFVASGPYQLQPGSYQLACKPGMTGDGIRTAFTVTGGTGASSPSFRPHRAWP